MDKYKVTNEDEIYYVEAETKNKARKEVLEKEGVTLEKVELEEVGDTTGDWIYLEQDEPRWSFVTLGNTNMTIGEYGCLVTSLSMLSYWYGDYFRPDEIANKSLFTEQGWYLWKSGDGYLPFDFKYRYYSRDMTKIKSILYSEDNAVIVRVSAYGAYHWLAVIGFDDISGQLIGADPLDGGPSFIEKEYGRINGFAEVKRK